MSNKLPKDFYSILRVGRDSTDEAIKNSYFKLAKEYHPDINPDYEAMFREISEAYHVLKDPLQKKLYDQTLEGVKESNTIKTYYKTHYHYGYTAPRDQEKEFKLNVSNPYASKGPFKDS